jgi:hypothetical protein
MSQAHLQVDLLPSGSEPGALQRVQSARRRLEEAQLAFHLAVSEARLAGGSLREIADAAGLSHTGVAKMDAKVRADQHHLGVRLDAGRWRRT